MMHRYLIGTSIGALWLGTMAPAHAQNDSAACQAKLAPWVASVASELRKLRLEILADRRELLQAKIKDIESELQAIQGRQSELQGEQQARTQQVSEIEGRLAEAALSKQEHEELEAEKEDLLAGSPPIAGAVLAQLAQQEAQARERLAFQQQRLQLLDRQVRQLSPGPN